MTIGWISHWLRNKDSKHDTFIPFFLFLFLKIYNLALISKNKNMGWKWLKLISLSLCTLVLRKVQIVTGRRFKIFRRLITGFGGKYHTPRNTGSHIKEIPKRQFISIAAGLNYTPSIQTITIKGYLKTLYRELKLSEDTCMMLSYGLRLLRYLGECHFPLSLSWALTTEQRT